MSTPIVNRNSDTILFELLAQKSLRTRNEKIAALESLSSFPEIQQRTYKLFSSYVSPCPVTKKNPHLLSDFELSLNIKALRNALSEHFSRVSNQSFSANSLLKIYGRKEKFDPQSQIYKEHYDKLKVSDLLEITGYTLETAKQFCNLEAPQLEGGLLILKSIDLALNNKPCDQPNLKVAHLVIDILASLAQKVESDPEARKRISGGAKIVQLAISFFMGQRDKSPANAMQSVSRPC